MSASSLKEASKEQNTDTEKKPLLQRFTFEEIWKSYPNKDGRKAAEKSFHASVKSETDYSDIKKALSNYLASDRVIAGYIKNGSTWFANWRDWIDIQTLKQPAAAASADNVHLSEILAAQAERRARL
jgi:hypothetical protein